MKTVEMLKMRWNKHEIFTLEKELARRYQKLLGKVRPRLVKIVDSNENFVMRASSKYFEVNRKFLAGNPSRVEMEENILHELIHYTGVGSHNEEFVKLAKKLKILDAVTLRCFLDEARARWDGCMEEVLQKDGSGKVIIHKKPVFERFLANVVSSASNGEAFLGLRRAYGLSRKKVAGKAGISEYQLRKIEKGAIARGAVFKKIYDAIVSTRTILK